MDSPNKKLEFVSDDEELKLTLSSAPTKTSNLIEFLSPTPTFNQPIPHQDDPLLPIIPSPNSTASRSRRNPNYGPPRGKEETIVPPFTWSTNRRAVVHTKDYLFAHGIHTISGEVECKKCNFKDTVVYDLAEKLSEVVGFISKNKEKMYERAPPGWMKPIFPACPSCPHAGFLRPVVASKKREINWLFLFLGQMVGICTLEQLKYFCKHNMIHRTGSKERLLFFAYIRICMQIDPKELS